ncbi:MAG TPA: Na/Pi cotransporter family protein [Devosia sp.]|nr:Na/Pi cotransporter family protein [Devosia sp.]
MDFTLAVLGLSGAVALFLWGTHMAQTGVQRALGPRLRHMLGLTLSNRGQAFLAGIGLTLLLQSSTATCLMAASFAANGMVDLLPAMAVMLGANVGTALIVQVLAFDVSIASPILILAGFLMFRRSDNSLVHDLGRALIGLGLMLLALHQMLGVLAGVEGTAEFRAAIGIVAAVPALGFVLAAIAAWGVHSSVAVVLLIISLASGGALPLDVAFIAVLGANLGTAINPLLEADAARPEARRLPAGNLGNRVAGIAAALLAVTPLAGWMGSMLTPAHAVAAFHLGFNLILALVMLPLLKPAQRALRTLLPDQPAANPAAPLYLDKSARETPIVALGGAAREALRLADVLEQMLHGAHDALVKNDRRLIEETRSRDDVLDGLNTAIKRYLTSIDAETLNEEDQRRLNQILVFSMNIEQAGDVIDRNLLPHVSKRLKRGLIRSDTDSELVQLMDRLVLNLRTAASLFMTEDARVARQLAEEKVAFRRAEREAVTAHFDVMRADRAGAGMQSALHLDLLRDMKLINSLIVAAAAYPVLDRAGELLPTRLVAQG